MVDFYGINVGRYNVPFPWILWVSEAKTNRNRIAPTRNGGRFFTSMCRLVQEKPGRVFLLIDFEDFYIMMQRVRKET